MTYRLTIKIAEKGTIYIPQDPNYERPHGSLAGHMWYSISDGSTEKSYGYAPGGVTEWDNNGYQSTYYTGTIIINKTQYDILKNFGQKHIAIEYGFGDNDYNVLSNSCIDFVWKALNLADLNPIDFQGNLIPTANMMNVDRSLYRFLFKTIDGWKYDFLEKDYNVLYGSNYDDDDLQSKNNTDVVYGGDGKDTIIGNNLNQYLYGNEGNDTIQAVGGKKNFLYGGNGDDILVGGNNSIDVFDGGNGYDIYHADENDTINDSDGSGKVYLSETKLKGGRFIKEQSHGNIEIYKSNDDSITYEYNTSMKVLSANGLKINDFDNNELEINLQKEQSNEFAILSDTTGSMGGAISSVKSQAKEIIKTAFARDKNTKVGVFGYNDPGVQTFTNLTNDQNAIMSAINSLYADGGGDTPEMTWHGIYNAANSNWSEYSVKRIFVFGDAPAKDNEFKSKAMVALLPNKPRAVARSLSAANALYGNNHSDLNNIQVFTIQTGGGEDVAAEFKELAESTGGGYVNMTNSGYTSVADALFDAMNTGTSKNETIVGNEKNNIINGKGGDDVLEGREGSDTYVFEENFGKDTIIETNKENKDKNIIDMSAFSLKDVVFRQNKNDVVVNRSKFDAVTIRDFYSDEEKISQIKFKDVTLGYEEIKDITALQSNKEVIKFANKGENKLKALLKKVFFKADDETATTIKGGVRSDALVGSNLNDKIYGNLGHDTLIGGKGDDYLDGGLGDDKYVFRKGDGKDVISDCGENDTLILKNINKNELELSKEKNDLILKFKEGSDQITIKDHFKRSLGYNHRLENIKFADGAQMNYKQIEDIVCAGEYTGGLKQASSLKNDYFVPQDTVNKIIEQLNSYADNSQALEFMSNNTQKDNIQIYMS